VKRSKELLPGYVAVRRLAHGRRLDTWDAYDEERDTRCVVKVLRADRLGDQEVSAAVLREGEILSSISHPHLVRCFDVVREPRPAIVLETLRGKTVSAHIEDGPLGVHDAAVLGVQLASVLGYLHRHGWLHLDVKPENVVNEYGKAVLIDLSLAGRPGDGQPGAGTPEYLAPEQERGQGLAPATDVWGLSMTLWECLAGDLPPTPLPASVPAATRELLRACLDTSPGSRPDLSVVRGVLSRWT
jgi:serine/threonine protein kinase